eukprot:GHVU01013497.1.p2 GENE.GHVU01013497.1~~GHVU01013497.1.p2  ORF type:complete len:112 (+),score=11.92 GHVU01013497.1:414-749(+)
MNAIMDMMNDSCDESFHSHSGRYIYAGARRLVIAPEYWIQCPRGPNAHACARSLYVASRRMYDAAAAAAAAYNKFSFWITYLYALEVYIDKASPSPPNSFELDRGCSQLSL